MLERVIENWLDKASELSLQVPFCNMLSADGQTVIHLTRHCGMELGKDVLSIAADGVPCAYQLKGAGGGRITLRRWREELSKQAFELVVEKVVHPSIRSTQHHRAYLVTNGNLDEEVAAAIERMNAQWVDSGQGHLRLNTIVRGELLAKAKRLESDLWPTEIPDVKALLELYLQDGRGLLPKGQLAWLFEQTLPLGVSPDGKKPSEALCSPLAVTTTTATMVAVVMMVARCCCCRSR